MTTYYDGVTFDNEISSYDLTTPVTKDADDFSTATFDSKTITANVSAKGNFAKENVTSSEFGTYTIKISDVKARTGAEIIAEINAAADAVYSYADLETEMNNIVDNYGSKAGDTYYATDETTTETCKTMGCTLSSCASRPASTTE